MATRTKRQPLTPEEREARREKEQELVKRSVEQLRSSDGWQEWLNTRSRFHKYSFGNQLLIAIQAQDMLEKGWVEKTPVRVAGFRAWLKLGYSVRKRPEDVPQGEWGLKIWAPVPPSKRALLEAQEKGEARPRTFFTLTSVFGDNQVEPLPEPAKPVPLSPPIQELEGDSLAYCVEPLKVLTSDLGCTFEWQSDLGRAAGYYRPDTKLIVVSEKQSVNARVKTFVHELAHALVRLDKQDDDPTLDYASEELVVESVALSVTGMLGLDTSGYSIPYLASWTESTDIEVLENTAKLINRLASRIEDALPESEEA